MDCGIVDYRESDGGGFSIVDYGGLDDRGFVVVVAGVAFSEIVVVWG
jgi:hypothetical protein